MNIKFLFLSSALLFSFPYTGLTAEVCDVDLCKEDQQPLQQPWLHFLSEDREHILSLEQHYQQQEKADVAFQLGHLYDTRSWKAQQAFNAIQASLNEGAQAEKEALLKITQESSHHSLKWYETAAIQGHPDGWLRLADLYGMASFFYKGYLPLSLSLYKRAAEQDNNAEAMHRLGSLYSAAVNNKDCLGPAGWYSSAQEDALRWYEAASVSGHAGAHVMLGNVYAFGLLGQKRNPEKAFHLYQKAAEKGHPQGYLILGQLYSEGAAQNLTKATDYYILSAQQGHPDAHKKLKELEQIPGPQRVPIKNYFEELLASLRQEESHIPYIQYKLGTLYEEGIGVEQSHEKAFAFYEKSASRDLPEALYKMGWIYENGHGSKPKDVEKAFRYYAEAIHYNNSQAHFRMGEIYARRRDISLSGERCYTITPRNVLFYTTMALIGGMLVKRLTSNPYLDIQANDLGVHNEWHPSAL